MTPPDEQSDAGNWSFDVAVVLLTRLRPGLAAAARSVFTQDFAGKVQILLGIATSGGDLAEVARLKAACPAHMTLAICNPGYTPRRNFRSAGSNSSGNPLRIALCSLASARYVAFLDENRWWGPGHLTSLRSAIGVERAGFAYARRSRQDGEEADPDDASSAGTPNVTIEISCLMIDRLRGSDVLWRLARPALKHFRGGERSMLQALWRKQNGVATGKETVFASAGAGRASSRAVPQGTQSLEPEKRPAATLASLRSVLRTEAMQDSTPTFRLSQRSQGPEVAADELFREILRERRPASIVDLWAGRGERTLLLAATAKAEGLSPTILAIDTWLPRPNDNKDRGAFAMQRHGASFARFQESVRKAGHGDLICALPGCPVALGTVLRQLGLRIDLAVTSAKRHSVEVLLAAWWPLIEDQGAAICDGRDGVHPEATANLRLFAATYATRIRLVGSKRNFLMMPKVADRPIRAGAAA